MPFTATAIYENGVLRLLTPLNLPEHTHVQVQIELVDDQSAQPAENVLQQLLALATDRGVQDLAEQHDHYLYGTAKR